MTNQIEDAIVNLIIEHRTPIDYDMLASSTDYLVLADRVVNRIDVEGIREKVIALFDASDIASNVDLSEIASELPFDEIANEICFSTLASHIDTSEVAGNLDLSEVAGHVDLSELAGYLDEDQLQDNVKDAVMELMATSFAAMERRIAMLEEKLAQQPQPQPQPSTPTQMIERAKNLLADALGMLSNPTV
jgi:hypothetical protein